MTERYPSSSNHPTRGPDASRKGKCRPLNSLKEIHTNSSVTPTQSNAVYHERLQQAKRVLLGLSEQQRAANFDINIYARRSDHGVIACIAGHCGLDPWFQERGFVTRVGKRFGDVSISPDEFFGTAQPFSPPFYSADRPATFDDAVIAMDRAIARFSSEAKKVPA
jgi:hypothetical protein